MPIQQMQGSKGVLDSPIGRALKAYYTFGGSVAADKAGLGGPSGALGSESLQMPELGSSLSPPPQPAPDPDQGLQAPQMSPYDSSQFQPQAPTLGANTNLGPLGRRMGKLYGGY